MFGVHRKIPPCGGSLLVEVGTLARNRSQHALDSRGLLGCLGFGKRLAPGVSYTDCFARQRWWRSFQAASRSAFSLASYS